MTSTLVIRKTPKPSRNNEWNFKVPIKGLVARRYYDHDGSLGGLPITIGPEELPWFEGVLAGIALSIGDDTSDYRDFEAVVNVLRSGNSIDLSIEV